MTSEAYLTGQLIKHADGASITNGKIEEMIAARGVRIKGNKGQKIREYIHELRVEGYPICANSTGYFWGNRKQVEHFLDEFNRRVASQHKAIEGMRRGRGTLVSNDTDRTGERLL